MTATHEQIVEEAERRARAALASRSPPNWSVTDYVIEVVREGWKPDPDVLAFSEWIVSPDHDSSRQAAYCAGARMARERAQAVSDALVQALEDYGNWDYCDKELKAVIDNYKAAR